MKYLVTIFSDPSHSSADRLGYFNDYFNAMRYLDSVESRFNCRAVYRVSASEFLNELPAYPLTVFRVIGKRFSPLGYFDTLKHADAFVRFYSAKYPFVKLIVSDNGLRTSSMDPEQTLF